MRVIAGLCKGRRLKSVKGYLTRPTADRVKEAVFNVLSHRIVNSKVLDLFGGTGNIGIEALSRGAFSVVFVEKSRKALQVLKENVISCGFIDKVEILPIDAFQALNLLQERNYKFNLIYLDPPYKLDIFNDLLEKINESNLLEDKGIVIVESAKDTELKGNFDYLNKVREDYYGDTKITYYQV